MTYKFIIPISRILISDSLPQATALRHIQTILPSLEGFNPAHIGTLKASEGFTHNGTMNWDLSNRDKSFIILSETDLVTPTYVHDSVIEFLRPLFIMDLNETEDTSHVTLFHRRLVYTGKQGHAHAVVHPEPSQNKRFSTINIIPGTQETMTPEQTKAIYDTY